MDQKVEVNCSISVGSDSAIAEQKLKQYVVTMNFITFLFGLPGNALILAVIRRRAVKSGTRVFMCALAAADLCTCSLRVLDTARILFAADTFSYKLECQTTLQFVVATLDLGMIQSAAFSAVVIAFNRCHAVCHPHSRRISPRKAILMSVACVVTAFLVQVEVYVVLEILQQTIVAWAYGLLLPLTLYVASMFLVVCFYGKILYFLRGRAKILAQPKGGGSDQQPDVSTMAVGTRHAHLTNGAESKSSDIKKCDKASLRPNLVKKSSGLSVEKQPERPQVCPQKTRSNKITTNLLLVTTSFFVLSLPYVGLCMSLMTEEFTSGWKSDPDRNYDDVLPPKLVIMWHFVFLKSVLNLFIYGLVDARFRVESIALLRRLKCCHRNP